MHFRKATLKRDFSGGDDLDSNDIFVERGGGMWSTRVVQTGFNKEKKMYDVFKKLHRSMPLSYTHFLDRLSNT